jgi:hypothetical protein
LPHSHAAGRACSPRRCCDPFSTPRAASARDSLVRWTLTQVDRGIVSKNATLFASCSSPHRWRGVFSNATPTGRDTTQVGSCAARCAKVRRFTTWTGDPASRILTSGLSTLSVRMGLSPTGGAERRISDHPSSAGFRKTHRPFWGDVSTSLGDPYLPSLQPTLLPLFANICRRHLLARPNS